MLTAGAQLVTQEGPPGVLPLSSLFESGDSAAQLRATGLGFSGDHTWQPTCSFWGPVDDFRADCSLGLAEPGCPTPWFGGI